MAAAVTRRARGGVIGAFAAMLVVLSSGLAHSTPPDPGAELLRQREQQRRLERLERDRPGTDLSKPGQSEQVASDFCFPIRSIEVEGMATFEAGALDYLTAPRHKTCMGQKEVEVLLDGIKRHYVTRGFITAQIVVPPQNLKSGTLRLRVVEGRVEAIRHRIVDVDGNEADAAKSGTWTAFPGLTGHPLDLRRVEQGIAQINRLPSSRATVDLEPGTAAGDTVLVVKETRGRQWRASTGFDFDGSQATGRARLRANLDFDNLLHLNDTWSASFAGARASNSLVGSFSIPFGAWTFAVNGSYSESVNWISPMADLWSETVSGGLSAERVVYRDDRSIVRSSIGASWHRNVRLIGATALDPTYTSSLRVGAEVEHFFENARVIASFGVAHGVPELIGQSGDGTRAPGVVDARFTKVSADFTLIHDFSAALRAQFNASAIYSVTTLPGSERLSVGGWSSVRGFRDFEISGDRGAYLRAELQWTVPDDWLKPVSGVKRDTPWRDAPVGRLGAAVARQVSLYSFVDGGVVASEVAAKATGLASVGVGVRLSGDNLSIDLAFARNVVHPDRSAPAYQAYLAATLRFQ
ncbi:MAG: ShlB/FhaC/HecB family hemolysin secretion/activation protein [Hyphomicrobiaceae bacterium]|nr:ShlB/FhaC/HecB family hemolysin secretion/activation protein [Hyphomicrobiaceae bacterium]